MIATMNLKETFRQDVLDALFPKQRSDQFFQALYGDVKEGAYDIGLAFIGSNRDRLQFEFQLTRRPGKCLACSLTYGLPQVFSRHPAIDLDGLVRRINQLLDGQATCSAWQLASTKERSGELHVIPLTLFVDH